MAADFLKYRNWKEIEKDIEALSIQGARNVARGSLHAVRLAAEKTEAKDGRALVGKVSAIALRIMNARPTEPMTRAVLSSIVKYGVFAVEDERTAKSAAMARKKITKAVSRAEAMMNESMAKIAEIGANYIQKGSTIMTYCHSSSVTNAIKKAYGMGRVEKVYVCETRPRYQGRITATELSAHGIDTFLIVDGAMATYAKKADIAMVGADAITSTGDLINKIGSCSLSMVFKEYAKPFVSVAEALKYDPDTAFGFSINIENRDAKEIWEKPPKKLKIFNPAFDQTPAGNIAAYITEVGIFPPSEIEEANGKAAAELAAAIEGKG
jgi:ribose 1,5-bisphosphate isomerase